jgi:uncharacterized protein YydD (DUF2326 family)
MALAIFEPFVFFLEIELEDASYVTVRRSVLDATKISFKKHEARNQDFSSLPVPAWDHADLPFDRARDLLDGLLDWRALKPWTYRKIVGYLIRSQDDYREVFHLRKFASRHIDWKPFLAHILGFDGELVDLHYQKEEQIEKKQNEEKIIQTEFGGSVEDISKIDGLLLLKQKEADRKDTLLKSFDFSAQDKAWDKQIVDGLDQRIADLTARRYSLNQNRKKIINSLESGQILFNTDEAQRLFREAGVLFEGQIRKDFDQLINFNRSITEERRGYLQEERIEIESEVKTLTSELNRLSRERAERLAVLTDSDVFMKYRQVSEEMVVLRADITSLERQRTSLRRLQELRTEIRQLTEEKGSLQSQIEADVEKQNADQSSLFSTIRIFFNEIVEEVMDRKALLSVAPNNKGNLEFKAEILDDSGNLTSADLGFTYRKLLCVAFDMAVLRARLDDRFPRFVYHDGVFESLDDRKKENLLTVIRRYTEIGIQQVITLIDSDLPHRKANEPVVFDESEVVLLLHDEDEQGQLFKMPSW